MNIRALPLGFVLILAACASGPLGADGNGTDDGDGTTPGGTATGSFTVEPEAPGEHCATGGIVLTTATSTSYVCNGLPGTPGASAADAVITDEPAGANCAAGGVSVATTTTVFYICDGANGADGTNGTNGATYVITAEPAGINCKTGGVRVQGADSVQFVCNGGADAGLCQPAQPGGVTAFYVTLTDSVLGPVQGSVVKPGFSGAMQGLGYCYNQRVPYDTTTGGVFAAQRLQEPVTVFIGDDFKVWPLLERIWDRQTVGTLTLSFYERSANGAAEVRADVVTLTRERIVALRAFPGASQNYLELAFAYAQLEWRDVVKQSVFTDTPVSFSAPVVETETCVVQGIGPGSEYVSTDGPIIAGDVEKKGRVAQIAASGICQTVAVYDGHRQHFPFTLVKQPDSSSIGFRRALADGTTIHTLKYERVARSSDGTQEIVKERITLTNAHVVAFEDVTDVDFLERIAFTYDAIEFVSPDNGNVSYLAEWDGQN